MVMRFGMSEKLGPRVFGHDHGQPFLGREFSAEPDYSDDVAREIDDEIRRIVEEAHQVARDILSKHRDDLDLTSDILMRRETIEREQFIDLLAGKSEDDIFGPMEPVRPPAADEPVEPEPKRKPAEGPRPLPRPGLAAEMRADDSSDKPRL
jgi:cell division protease FtsH